MAGWLLLGPGNRALHRLQNHVATWATDLIQARAIQDACEVGCRYYYLGESGTGTLGQFNERLGARPIISPEFRFERLPVTRVERGIKRRSRRSSGFRIDIRRPPLYRAGPQR